jgi:hypothetical protein
MGDDSNTLSQVCTRSQGEPFVQSHCDTHFAEAGTLTVTTITRLTSHGQRSILTSFSPGPDPCSPNIVRAAPARRLVSVSATEAPRFAPALAATGRGTR